MHIYKEMTKLFVTRVTMVLIAIQHKFYIERIWEDDLEMLRIGFDHAHTRVFPWNRTWEFSRDVTERDLRDRLLVTYGALPAYIIKLLFSPKSVRPCVVYLPEHL